MPDGKGAEMNAMRVLDNLVLKATGLPDRVYLNDPVVAQQFLMAQKKVPLLLAGWFVCMSLTGVVSFVLPISVEYQAVSLVLLVIAMAFLLSQLHCLHPEKALDEVTLRELLEGPLTSLGVKKQLHYVYVNKLTPVSWGDVYRLYDINHQTRWASA